jgi:preprotein translocase subunit SecA
MFRFLMRLFGTQNERAMRKLMPLVEKINSFESEFSGLSDEDLKGRIAEIKKNVLEAKELSKEEIYEIREKVATSSSEQERNKHKRSLREAKNRVLDDKLPEVFAAVREASKRTIGLRHFDVQLLGGIVLHQGKIAEMTTGEGKTLVATLPVVLNSLNGESVHVVTVNDYLAKRDSEWMSPIYNFLGLTVGVIQHDMKPEDRQKAYACDVVYGTNNEFGFDYLRDNMVMYKEYAVQGYLGYAIVDEVDSILIDEARTPLIISGPVDEANESYDQMKPIVQEVVRSQRKTVGNYLAEFRKVYKEGAEEKAGNLLYLVHKAEPKNRELLDIILKDLKAKSLFDKAQGALESKVMEKERDQILEELYYIFDEKTREATFSAKGQEYMKERFGFEFMLEDIESSLAELADQELPEDEKTSKEMELVAEYSEHQKKVDSIKQLLKAFILFQKDVDYVVQDNKIVIVDSFTGRMMPGRRFSDGIHEAIEAKENVEVQKESQTLATITLQNFFRMYDKLSGMTGTAKTEEGEFEGIYLLPVLQIPTNRPMRRTSMPDRIYKTEKEKFNAVVDEIVTENSKGRPVLVGTISIEKSEYLSRLLGKRGVKHNVLNAKYHEKEAQIIAQAGSYGSVTIATNMAGRGTDILLGGNPENLAQEELSRLDIELAEDRENVYKKYISEFTVKTKEEKEKVLEAGGLHVLGTERHEARRIDNQLRGRSGRQGDPGSSRFYLSLEDDLMRIFGSDRIKMIMDRLGMEEGEVIENPLVTRAVSTAQKRVEGQNFEVRKHLLKYDNVMNQQREIIYGRRNRVLAEQSLKEEFFECLDAGVDTLLEGWDEAPDEKALTKELMMKYAISVKAEAIENLNSAQVRELVTDMARKAYHARENFIGIERMRHIEKMLMLSTIDSNWKEYLREVDDLREGISWRAYGQKDPLIEFQHEAFQLFSDLMARIDEETAEGIMKLTAMEEQHKKSVFISGKTVLQHSQFSSLGSSSAGQDEVYDAPEGGSAHAVTVPQRRPSRDQSTFKREDPKVGRNEACPCGSGKKYKKCCGM